MYKYFKAIVKTEHMLYASELARAYGIYTVNKEGHSPHSRLVTELLKDYVDNNGLEVEELYYQTSKGLARVYPTELYIPAIEWFIKKVGPIEEYPRIYTSNKGTKYQFTLGG